MQVVTLSDGFPTPHTFERSGGEMNVTSGYHVFGAESIVPMHGNLPEAAIGCR